jgi:hypothetical protein
VIAVYVNPESLTAAQYQQVAKRLEESGAPTTGRKHHSCFGEDGHLMIFDIWESQEEFNRFVDHLGPILGEVGVTGGPPAVMPVVAFVQ